MSAIDMSEMRLIRKQIFFSLGLFFLSSQLGAMACPQTVGPISINDGAWSLLSRVGSASNVIQSQICELNFSASSTAATTSVPNNCIQFGQSDIGSGGGFTISAPGVYCMYNDANWSTGAAITVNASNVTIDMQNHTLNGGSSGATGIVINGGVSNVTIKNGNIVNPTVACIANNSSISLLYNIIIHTMNFSVVGGTTSYPGFLIQQNAATVQCNSVSIENCTGYNCYISLAGCSSCVVRECLLVSAMANGNASIAISGSAAHNTQLVTIENCTLVNDAVSYPAALASFFLEFVSMAIMRNCISFGSGSTTAAFSFSAVARPVLYNCVAQQCVRDGFYFVPGAAGATPPVTVSAVNCLAEECFNGFLIVSVTGNVGYNSLELTNCVSQNNNSCGFKINNDGTGTIPFIFRNCVANANTADGFEIGGGNPGAIGYGVITECTSSENSSNGFLFSAPSTHLVVENCTAVSNPGYGFFDAGTFPTNNYYIANRSFANGTDYTAAFGAQFTYPYGSIYYGGNQHS